MGVKTTRHRKTKCEGCGNRLDASTIMVPAESGERDTPVPGDLSICFYCGQPMRYRRNLKLVALTSRDMAKLRRDDFPLYMKWERMHAALKEKRGHLWT